MSGEKKASKSSIEAMHDADRHATGTNDSIPGNEAHSHSEAAHLGSAHEHTKPVGDIRKIELKEEANRKISRAGQGNRGE